MRMPVILSIYIGRNFCLSILFALLGLGAVAGVIDTIELIRRASTRPEIQTITVLQMALLRLPFQMDRLLPFAVLIGGMFALTKLTRTHELIVARAAGISVWQFLTPALIAAFGLGMLFNAVLNPISSVMLLKFEQMEGKYFKGQPSLMSISSSGLWLRQIEQDGGPVAEHIIYSQRVSQSDMSFSNVIIFSFDRAGKFIERLDAERALLMPGELQMTGVTRSLPGKSSESAPAHNMPTTLTLEHIQDSFASPETMSFWYLPYFVGMLEKAGFSAIKHRLYWQSLLAKPLLLCGMILVGALFSLRLPRRGHVGLLVVAGMITGFSFHFFTDIVHALGSAGTLPIALAAWAPAMIMLVIGAGTLLHLEDG